MARIRSESVVRLAHVYDSLRAVLGQMPPGKRDEVIGELVVFLTMLNSQLRKWVYNWEAMPDGAVFGIADLHLTPEEMERVQAVPVNPGRARKAGAPEAAALDDLIHHEGLT